MTHNHHQHEQTSLFFSSNVCFVLSTMTEQYDGLRLHELAHQSAWAEVLMRLKSHPQEALHVVETEDWLQRQRLASYDSLLLTGNLTALHLVCTRRNPPLEVIKAYLKAQPSAIKILTFDSKSPLSLACFAGASPEIISYLARAYPDAMMLQDHLGWNVFHIFSRFETPERLLSTLIDIAGPERTEKALLMCDRKGRAPIHFACGNVSRITKDNFALLARSTRMDSLNRLPLKELCTQYRRQFQSALTASPIPSSAISTTDDPSQFCKPKKAVPSVERFWMWRPQDALALRRCWNMAFVLLGADGVDMSTYPLLHECLERDDKGTTEMFEYVLCLNPHYACHLRPSDGTLPLHVLARLAVNGEEHWIERIRTLVRLYPKGAGIPDQEGRLPLELLAQPTVTWEHVSPVLEAAPQAIAKLDLPENLYPQVLSQLAIHESWDALYQIIRETPTLTQPR